MPNPSDQKQQLLEAFRAGKKPSESDFRALIDLASHHPGAYQTEITGTGASIPAPVHGQGAGRAVVVQFYQGDGRLMHGVDVINQDGDIHWSTNEPVSSGSFVVIRG